MGIPKPLKKTYQSKRQLDDTISPVGCIYMPWLLPPYSHGDVVSNDFRLVIRGACVGVSNTGVCDVATRIDVGQGLVCNLQSWLDVDVPRFGNRAGGDAGKDLRCWFLTSTKCLGRSMV